MRRSSGAGDDLWHRLHFAVLDQLGVADTIGWAPAWTGSMRYRGIAYRSARRGIESSEKLGRFRSIVDRTFA